MRHLDDIGLIKLELLSEFSIGNLPKSLRALYYEDEVILELNKENENKIDVGAVVLTKVGAQLAPLTNAQPVDGFMVFVLNRWARAGLAPRSEWPKTDRA